MFFGASRDPKRRFVVQSIEGGGWGGRPFEDGESGTVSVCQGDVRNGSIEGIELKCPVLVEAARSAPFGGAGKYRGGLGIDMRVRNLIEGNCVRQARRPLPAMGPVGRRCRANTGMYCCARPARTNSGMMGGAHTRSRSNAEVIVRTGGGGGWATRSSAIRGGARRRREELVSQASARDDYGVALRDDLSIDQAATEQQDVR